MRGWEYSFLKRGNYEKNKIKIFGVMLVLMISAMLFGGCDFFGGSGNTDNPAKEYFGTYTYISNEQSEQNIGSYRSIVIGDNKIEVYSLTSSDGSNLTYVYNEYAYILTGKKFRCTEKADQSKIEFDADGLGGLIFNEFSYAKDTTSQLKLGTYAFGGNNIVIESNTSISMNLGGQYNGNYKQVGACIYAKFILSSKTKYISIIINKTGNLVMRTGQETVTFAYSAD